MKNYFVEAIIDLAVRHGANEMKLLDEIIKMLDDDLHESVKSRLREDPDFDPSVREDD